MASRKGEECTGGGSGKVKSTGDLHCLRIPCLWTPTHHHLSVSSQYSAACSGPLSDMRRGPDNLTCLCILPLSLNSTSLYCCNSLTINKCPHHSLFSATFFALPSFQLVIGLFRRALRHTVKALVRVAKPRKVVIWSRKNTYVLLKLHSGLSYKAVGHKFNMLNKDSLQSNTRNIRFLILRLIGWWKCCGPRLAGTKLEFPLGAVVHYSLSQCPLQTDTA